MQQVKYLIQEHPADLEIEVNRFLRENPDWYLLDTVKVFDGFLIQTVHYTEMCEFD